MAIKRILVPVDFSSDSLRALAYARDFAKRFKAELNILYVLEPIYYATPADMYAATPSVAMLQDEQRKLGVQQLARLAADMKKRRQPCRTLLKTGSPATEIVDAAKRSRADLIIMGTHGRTGVAHMLMGSVAEKVVRTAGCPVLTVRPGAVKRTTRRKKR